MRINKIELKNFRNHKEAVFEFERGINLILGDNGSGKTSILDAISFALFNMTLRSNAGETLTVNETSGYVKVSFTGNDNNFYIVTRKFPAGTVSLSEEGVNKNITGVTEVYRTINSLIGNTAENPALFENVIVASQNKFTTIFDAKPSEREAVFNSVFGTEIYRQMYRGILKQSYDVYNTQLTFAGGELESRQSQLKDPLELKKARDAAEKEYSSAEKVYAESEKKIEKAEKGIRDFEKVKTAKEKLLIEIKGVAAQIEEKKKLINSIDSDLKTAEAAVLEETKLKPQHDEYEKVKSQQELITEDINVLEKTEKEFNANKDKIAEHEKEKTKAEGDIKRLNQQAESDTITAEGLKAEIVKLSESINTLQKDKSMYETEMLSLRKRKRAFDELHTEYKSARDESAKKALLAGRAEESSAGEETLKREIAVCETEYTELELLKTKRDLLNSKITRFNTLITELESAERDLSRQSCPYLKEPCRNIEHAGSLSGYFGPRKKNIAEKIAGLEAECAVYKDLDIRFKNCANNKSTKNEQLAALRKNIHEALKYRKEESELKQKTAEYALALAKLFTGLNGKDAAAVSKDDYDGAAAEMLRTESELKTRIAGINESLNEKQSDHQKKEKALTDILKSIETAEKNASEIIRLIEVYNTELKTGIELNREFEKKIIPLAGLKKQTAEYALRLKELEPADRQYRSAAQSAAGKNRLHERLASEKTNVNVITEKFKKINEEYNTAVYNAGEHEKLLTLCAGLKSELKEQNNRKMSLKSAFDIAVQAEEINSRLLREIEEKSEQINALKRKMEIAETFRENIKMLGPYISERRTKMIAAAATDNFHRMTGRAERILWENNTEPYLVSIASAAGKCRYNMLSGGEQVAVALSIRSALASEMTDCRFAIFDEPTINLDAEKREALSVSLYDMLKNLEQALVVTHDAAFREMATKVIELGRR